MQYIIRTGSIENLADSMRRDFLSKQGSTKLGQTVFLIGAGCSRSAGVPLASEIARELTVRLALSYGLITNDVDDPIKACEALIEAKKYPSFVEVDAANGGKSYEWSAIYDHIFTEHYATPKEVQPLFAEFCDRAHGKINWAHVCLGELVRLGFVSTVITTNFDQLVLEGMARSGKLPVVADGIDSLNRVAGEPSHPQLIQIHGSRHTYYLRNSQADLSKIADDDGARHAIDELIRGAKTFVVIGYGGRETGLMKFLISAGRRWPDTQIFWVKHSSETDGIAALAEEFLNTSSHSRIIENEDADGFFMRLCQLLGIGAPRSVTNPLTHLAEFAEQIVPSSDPNILNVINDGKTLLQELQYFQSLRRSRASNTEEIIAKASEYRLSGRFDDELDLLTTALEAGGDRIIRRRLEDLISNEASRRLHDIGDAPIPSLVVDELGTIVTHNALFANLSGIKRDQKFPSSIFEILPSDEKTRVLLAIRSSAENVRPKHQLDVLFGDPHRTVRLHFNSLKVSEERRFVRIYVVDLTIQRNMESKILQSQRMELVGHLAGGIAHDFNNLLSAIMMATEFLLKGTVPSEPSFQDIMQIKQNTTRGATLVRQLLAFSRRQILSPREVNVREALADLAILLQRLIGERVKLKLDVDESTWPIVVDVSQFEQVIVNLVVNARDAMPMGGNLNLVAKNVDVSEDDRITNNDSKSTDFVCISVIDDGDGIPAELLDSIFDPFFTTKASGKGTGLGLSTVYGIVSQSGGHVFVRSERNEGTKFDICLPRSMPDARPQIVEQEKFSVIEKNSPRRPIRPGATNILLVEDEGGLRLLIARGLRSHGFQVKMRTW